MKVYLVGGAVRDKLLGFPLKERDWVVVGGTPQQLIDEGYQQVGRDFPVFLHPETREEYALARTERKQAAGYYGFACDFNPDVSLKADLMRRDLTINAMAMDEHGEIIDPYGGQRDLENKLLRHVSPAFAEDPVRVLRLARFAARYHHLGFTIADETRSLMVSMVRSGELAHLVPERVWQEFEKSLQERHPEQFILALRQCGALAVVLPELDKLFGIPNPPMTCPLIDSGMQALDTLQRTAALTKDSVLRFAALFHDIGHGATPMHNWPHHAAAPETLKALVSALCERLRIPNIYEQLLLLTAQFYPKLQKVNSLDAESKVTLLEHCDAFRRPALLTQLVWLTEVIAQHLSNKQIKKWLILLNKCVKISPQILIAQGYKGEDIKKGLHRLRVEAVLNESINDEA